MENEEILLYCYYSQVHRPGVVVPVGSHLWVKYNCLIIYYSWNYLTVQIKLLVLDCNIWNHLTEQTNEFWFLKIVTYYLFIYKYLYKQDLALSSIQVVICHKIQPTNLYITFNSTEQNIKHLLSSIFGSIELVLKIEKLSYFYAKQKIFWLSQYIPMLKLKTRYILYWLKPN